MPTLGAWIERRAAIAPADLAVVHGDARLTYADLARRVRASAATLARLGVRGGDRVAFHGRNEPAALESLFAAAALGAAWVPIHPARPEAEVRFILEDSGVSVLVRGEAETTPATSLPAVAASALAEPGSETRPEAALPPGSESDLAVLAYTSGTTGPPRGVVLTHANLTWNVVHVLSACAISRADVVLAAAPLTRVGGLAVTVLEGLFVGATIVIPATLDGATVLETLERERVGVLFANPDLLEAVAAAPAWPRASLSGIRTAIVGGGLAPEGLLRRYHERGVLLRHGYGLTEAAPVVTLLDERDAMSHARTVGRPIGFVETRTVRADGAGCGAGEVGELAIRGPNVTSGYWRSPEASAAARMSGGWWRTGDAAAIDAGGYVTLVGRVKDAIELPAGRVHPAELERRLYGAPGIEDAAAVDVDGSVVVAVVPRPGAAPVAGDLLERIRPALPAGAPHAQFRVVSRIPRNASGKILRGELRDGLRGAPPAQEALPRRGPPP